jgi:hypothetical protein
LRPDRDIAVDHCFEVTPFEKPGTSIRAAGVKSGKATPGASKSDILPKASPALLSVRYAFWINATKDSSVIVVVQ